MKKTLVIMFVIVLSLGLVMHSRALEDPIGPKVEPWSLTGSSPTCSNLVGTYGDVGAFWYELKFDEIGPATPNPWTLPILGTGYEITIYLDLVGGEYKIVAFESDLPVDAVLLKSGTTSHRFYVYDGWTFPGEWRDQEETWDNNLQTPQGISHVSFCYDFELDVTKTAETEFTRSYVWTIDKFADQIELLLAPGMLYTVNYEVAVEVDDYIDSDWAVSGVITINNPDPQNKAYITSVADEISDYGSVDVDCDWDFTVPYQLYPHQTLVCSYSADDLNGTEYLNTAVVEVSETSLVGGGTATADILFGDPTDEVDECIDVMDTLYGNFGIVCVGVDDLPAVFNYSLTLGQHPYADVYLECGETEVTNTASFAAQDTGAEGEASWTITAVVACEEGCTLTIGYWKTHSIYGPAPYDDTWEMIGEDTPFYLSGKSYIEVFWTPVAGNAYYILAPQFIAAKLNELNGAYVPADVVAVMDWADTFFQNWNPANTLPKDLRKQVVQAAETLDLYNNGELGTPHCSISELDIYTTNLYAYPGLAIQKTYLPMLGR